MCSAVTTTNKNSAMAAPVVVVMPKRSPAPVKAVPQMVYIQCLLSTRQCGFGADVCLDENALVKSSVLMGELSDLTLNLTVKNILPGLRVSEQSRTLCLKGS